MLPAPCARKASTKWTTPAKTISQATATFEDGRVFTEIGDCGPQNCAPMIAVHSCRMACTRAKGRALRDALNIGEAMVEELGPDMESAPRSNGYHTAPEPKPAPRARHDPQRHAEQKAAAAAPEPETEYVCEECGAAVEAETARAAIKRFRRVLCIPDGKAEQARVKEIAATASA